MKYTRLRLKTNVISYNYKVYGKAGEEVKIVSEDHDPVLIVQNKNGERYPVHKDKIEFIYELS